MGSIVHESCSRVSVDNPHADNPSMARQQLNDFLKTMNLERNNATYHIHLENLNPAWTFYPSILHIQYNLKHKCYQSCQLLRLIRVHTTAFVAYTTVTKRSKTINWSKFGIKQQFRKTTSSVVFVRQHNFVKQNYSTKNCFPIHIYCYRWTSLINTISGGLADNALQKNVLVY